MLHDPADVCNSPLNFISNSSCLTQPDLVSTSTPSHLNSLNASLNCSAQKLKSDLLPSSSSSSSVAQAAEKLSWKFFEQVDTLDHQLRIEAVSVCLYIYFLLFFYAINGLRIKWRN